jgi:hypothetical protein
MQSVTLSVLLGAALAAAGVGAALALTPERAGAKGQAIILATGDGWGEVEPCG